MARYRNVIINNHQIPTIDNEGEQMRGCFKLDLESMSNASSSSKKVEDLMDNNIFDILKDIKDAKEK